MSAPSIETVAQAADRARAGEGPTLIEALTYRHKGHSRADPAEYRPEEELEEWLERDPIELARPALLAAGVGRGQTGRGARATPRRACATALERALAWAEPDLSRDFEDVWA